MAAMRLPVAGKNKWCKNCRKIALSRPSNVSGRGGDTQTRVVPLTTLITFTASIGRAKTCHGSSVKDTPVSSCVIVTSRQTRVCLSVTQLEHHRK